MHARQKVWGRSAIHNFLKKNSKKPMNPWHWSRVRFSTPSTTVATHSGNKQNSITLGSMKCREFYKVDMESHRKNQRQSRKLVKKGKRSKEKTMELGLLCCTGINITREKEQYPRKTKILFTNKSGEWFPCYHID